MRATIRPQGSGFSMISKVKENYIGLSWISVYNVFVIDFAVDDEELERFLKQNLLRGFFWSALLKTHKSSSHPTFKCTHTSFILAHSSHMHTHSPPSAANTANSADLPESQPALQLPSLLQTGNPQLPGLTPHANAVKQNLSLQLIHLDNPSKVSVPYLL